MLLPLEVAEEMLEGGGGARGGAAFASCMARENVLVVVVPVRSKIRKREDFASI